MIEFIFKTIFIISFRFLLFSFAEGTQGELTESVNHMGPTFTFGNLTQIGRSITWYTVRSVACGFIVY